MRRNRKNKTIHEWPKKAYEVAKICLQCLCRLTAGISWHTTTNLGSHASESPRRFKSSRTNQFHNKEGQRRTKNCFQGLAGACMANMATPTRLVGGIFGTVTYSTTGTILFWYMTAFGISPQFPHVVLMPTLTIC